MTDLEVLNQMVKQDNQGIVATTTLLASQSLKKYAKLTMAIANETHTLLAKQFVTGKQTHSVIAYIVDNDEFDKTKGNGAPATIEWISVKDQLPEIQGDVKNPSVLTVNDEGNIAITRYSTSEKLWMDLNYRAKKITHWMPLPPKP